MGLDIRLPIGWMFTVFGVLLTGFGIFGDRSIYQRSLGIDVNLYWGVVLLFFGLTMTILGQRGTRAMRAKPLVRDADATPPRTGGH